MKDIFEAMREAKERKRFYKEYRKNALDEVKKQFERFCEFVNKKLKESDDDLL